MSFEDGFDAIARVKASSEKLGKTINKIEELQGWLSELRVAQAGAEATFAMAKAAVSSLEEIAADIINQQKILLKEVQGLPASVQEILHNAESRFAAHQSEIELLVTRLPDIINAALEQKLTVVIGQMETRLNERLRDELKDTRTTLRETLEYGANRTEMRLDEVKKEIISALPRGLFGRRGN